MTHPSKLPLLDLPLSLLEPVERRIYPYDPARDPFKDAPRLFEATDFDTVFVTAKSKVYAPRYAFYWVLPGRYLACVVTSSHFAARGRGRAFFYEWTRHSANPGGEWIHAYKNHPDLKQQLDTLRLYAAMISR